jgi:hypothetical protein
MTLEEKDKVIQDYCDDCATCCIKHLCGVVEGDFLSDESVCTLAYDLVTKINKNNNAVTHPTHYNQGSIECWDAMESAFGREAVMKFCKLNAFKYLWRSNQKNGYEDIQKATNYLDKYKELVALNKLKESIDNGAV